MSSNTHTSSRLIFASLIALVLFFFSGDSWSQLSITSGGTPFNQNFDGIGSTAGASLPSGWRMSGVTLSSTTSFTGAASVTNAAAGTTGTGALTGASSGAAYNFANGITASSTDRAIGFLSAGGFTSPRAIFVQITNNTGQTITDLSISFDYEKYRSGTRAFDWTFSAGSDGTTWTGFSSGDQSYASDANNTVIFNPPTGISKSVTITGLNITNGGSYYLRWLYTGVGGSTNAQAIGVDNFSVTATTAVASNDNLSDIISDGTFTPTANINYSSFQETDLTSSSLVIGRFIIRDGAGSSDADAASTTLTGVTFTVAGGTNVRRLAIYDGTTEIAEIAGGASASFTGLNLVAPDNGSKTFSLRASFNAPVTDNVQISYTISSASAAIAGSGFAAGNAGGAATNTTGDNNRIEVTATTLNFTTQPSNTLVGVNMAPSVVVRAQDGLASTDADFVGTVNITSSGTLATSPVSVAAVAGVATFNAINHTVSASGRVLTAASAGLTNGTSNTFNILGAPIAAWDFFGITTTPLQATFAATSFNSNLVSSAGANNITRGPNATASAGANSFRTVGFSNDGIAVTNNDYFQVTITPVAGYAVSLSAIDARVAGTATYANAPGVNQQFAYSLDGSNFTLIGSPLNVNGVSSATLPTVDVSAISALQNVPAGTTIYIRYYATGQTTTGGWGFNSPASGQNGLAISGSVALDTNPNILLAPTSLTGFSQVDTNPSAEQSYTVSGDNLTNDITINAPVGFQISTTSGSGFTNTLTIPQSGGNVIGEPVTVYVVMNTSTIGVNTGNIAHTSAGATTKNVAVSGVRTARFYSKSSGDLNLLSTWGENTNGTGNAPADFTTGGQVFEVRNRATATISAAWTVSGAASKVVVGDGTNAVDFTIPSGFAFTGTVDVSNEGELTIENTTLPTFGTLAAGSTIEYKDIALNIPNTTADAITYRNLKLSGTGVKTFKGSNTDVTGNLTLDNTTLNGPGASPFATLRLTGNLTYVGTVTPPADANSITLFTNGTAGGTQTISGGTSSIRWFRIQVGTANTVSVTGTGGILVANNSGGGITVNDGGTLDIGSTDLTIFNSAATSTAFTFGTSGRIAVNGSNWLLQRTVINTLGTIRFHPTSNTIGNLTLNHNTDVSFTLASNVRISGVLNMQAGSIAMGANNITFANTGSITYAAGPNGTNRLIAVGAGEVRREFPTGASNFSWFVPVGDATLNVTPCTIIVNGTATNGVVGVNLTDAKSPLNLHSTNFITRYWTLSQTGFTSVDVRFAGEYVSADVVGNENDIVLGVTPVGSTAYTAFPGTNISGQFAFSASTPTIIGQFTGINGLSPQVTAGVDDNEVCSGTTINLSATGSGDGAVTYAWTSNPAGFTATGTAATAAPTVTTVYTVMATDINGVTATSNVTVTITSEICGDGIDNDCDTFIDEGCPVGPANDTRIGALIISGTSFPACSSLNGNLATANNSPEALTIEPLGAGQDVWYRFVAQTNGVRIQANSSSCNLVLELQNAAGTTLIASENETATGSEILVANNLTPGQTYYLAVRNFSTSSVGAFTYCIQHLRAPQPDNGTSFSSLCGFIKARWTGASLYTITFTQGSASVSASSSSTQIPFSAFPGVIHNASYQVVFTSTFNQLDAAGNPTQVIVTSAPFTITINNHPPVNLRSIDRCPVTRSVGSFIATDINVCGISGWDWEFQEVDVNNELIAPNPTIVESTSTSRFIRVSSIPGVQPGSFYRVRVRPRIVGGLFTGGPGSFAGDSFVLCVAGSAGMETDPNVMAQERSLVVANDEIATSFEVYPNPNRGDMFQMTLAEGDHQIRITDAMGRIVFTDRYVVEGTNTVAVVLDNQLASGLYHVESISAGVRQVARMIVE